MTDRDIRHRPARPEDIPALVALVLRCDAVSDIEEPGDPREEEARLTRPTERLFVAEAGEAIVGFVSFRPAQAPGTGHVSNLFVDPSRWGEGIGRALLARAVEEMRSQGWPRAELNTQEANPRARRLYEAAGWRDSGTRRERKGATLIVYEIAL